MTGPAVGKFPIKAKVFLKNAPIPANVYIHLKGYALARVTHLDIEGPKLNLMAGKGSFLNVHGIDGGLEIPELNVKVNSRVLNAVLKAGKKTRTWIGQKADGIYIGFRKTEMKKLEKIAKMKAKEAKEA